MPILDFMNDVKPLAALEPFPEADYEVSANEIEEKQSANGSYLRVVFEVMEGDHAGRKIYQNITFKNTSEKAQEYGQRFIKGWATACNKPLAMDTDELIDIPCSAHVYIEPAEGGYAEKNQISIFNVGNVVAYQPPSVTAPAPAKAASPTPSVAQESPAAVNSEPPAQAPAAAKPAPAAKAGGNPWDD